MGLPAETGRDFWRGVLVAGGFTAVPRWTLEPATGVAEHRMTVPDDLVAGLRRLADELAVPPGSLLLAAHAKVLAVLSGEREVVTGYVAVEGGRPLPCRLTTEPDSWRTVVLDAHRVESELLSHRGFPVDELRRELPEGARLFDAHTHLGNDIDGMVGSYDELTDLLERYAIKPEIEVFDLAMLYNAIDYARQGLLAAPLGAQGQ